MTARDFLAALYRGWYVVLVGMVLTAALAHSVQTSRGVYWAHVEIFLVGPRAGYEPNAFIISPDSLIATAGLIQRDVTGVAATARVVSDAVTLPGQGVEAGTLTRLLNEGGQWANNFSRPVLDVQTVDATATGASLRMQKEVRAITARLETRQRNAGAPPEDWITVRLVPSIPQATYVHGDQRRGFAGALLVGALATMGSVFAVELMRRRRTLAGTANPNLPAAASPMGINEQWPR